VRLPRTVFRLRMLTHLVDRQRARKVPAGERNQPRAKGAQAGQGGKEEDEGGRGRNGEEAGKEVERRNSVHRALRLRSAARAGH
jgi:hypothetical protein